MLAQSATLLPNSFPVERRRDFQSGQGANVVIGEVGFGLCDFDEASRFGLVLPLAPLRDVLCKRRVHLG